MRPYHGHISRMVIGLDLGQKRDHSALALIECRETEYDARDPVTFAFVREIEFRLHCLQRIRLGTPYPEVSAAVKQWVKRCLPKGECSVVVDGTGVGWPVVEMLQRSGLGCRVIPVLITGGERQGSEGGTFRVPKVDLIGGLQVMVEQKQLKIERRAGEVEQLVSELMGMKQRGRSIEGKSDDLALALALAWWWAKKPECGWRGGRLV